MSDLSFKDAFAVVLFVGGCVGHVALVIRSHNWWYAAPVSRFANKFFRIAHAVLMFGGLLLFWSFYGLDLPDSLHRDSVLPWPWLLNAYLFLCWFVAFGVFPAITLARLVRRLPAALLSNHTQTLDVAKELGYKPLGRGKHRLLARLPRNEVFQVDLAERTFRLPGLPAAWDGLTILHLSDLHFCGTPDRIFYRRVLNICAGWEPDLVAITGDIVDSNRHHRWIMPLLGRLRWKVAAFAILGNHDLWRDPPLVRRRLQKIRINVLANSWQQIDVRGVPMVVIGHEGPWFQPAPDLTACPRDVFRLCLSHTPDNIRWARQNDVRLMLSGHNHGGQVRFPLFGSVFVPSRYSRRYDCGIFHEPPTLLHVSRGLGSEHPLRYNCRPEVTKIVLRS
jgi:predicted MPP superfamily phosphohydrolase